MTSERFETLHAPSSQQRLHRHHEPYLALVLEGEYVEASADGVWRCVAGTVVAHPALHAHANAFVGSGARVLNVPIPWRNATVDRYAVWRLPGAGDPERIWAQASVDDILNALRHATRELATSTPARIASIARLIDATPDAQVAAVAQRAGLSREYASRAFREHFGMSPRVYRSEHRLRFTIALLRDSRRRLSEIAAQAGYSDQSHMIRTVRTACGLTPGQLRRLLS